MVFLLLSLVGGLTFLTLGAEALVRGGGTLGKRAGLSPLFIGLTVVAWGTSLPEFTTMLQSALTGAVNISVGDVIGSNILNVFLVLGLTALIRPIRFESTPFRTSALFMLLVTMATVGVLYQFPSVPRFIGPVAVALLLLNTYTIYRQEKSRPHRAPTAVQEYIASRGPLAHPLAAGALVAVGIAGLLLGARLLVEAATQLAAIFHVSQSVIGLTVVAIGTTLPELFATVSAALHRQPHMAIGNVVGSNIFNLLGILAPATTLTPVQPESSITSLSMYAMLAAAAALLLFGSDGRLKRAEGIVLLTAYIVYLGLLLA